MREQNDFRWGMNAELTVWRKNTMLAEAFPWVHLMLFVTRGPIVGSWAIGITTDLAASQSTVGKWRTGSVQRLFRNSLYRCMLVIPALLRWRHVDHELGASLGYIDRP